MDDQKKRNTIRLIERAYSGETLDQMLEGIKASRKLNQILLPRMRKMSNEVLADLTGCSRAYVYGIMNGKKHPEKDMLLRIAFVLGMSVDETQEMLKTAHRAALSSIDKRDICIIFGLAQGLNLEEMDDVLIEKGQKPLSAAAKEDEKLLEIISYQLEDKKIKEEELLRRIKCSEQLYQDIMEEIECAPRDLLIRMAFVLEIGLAELQTMLRIEKAPLLTVKNTRDMFIMNGLANNLPPEKMDETLIAQGQKPLWEAIFDLPLEMESEE